MVLVTALQDATQLFAQQAWRESSLTAVGRFAKRMGLEQFAVELHARSSTPRIEAQPIL